MTAKRGAGVVRLFPVDRPARRCLPALERTFRALTAADVDAGAPGHTYRALARTLCETIDDRDASLHSMATAAAQVVDLVRLLAGEDLGAATFDEIVAALSAAPGDGAD